MDAWIEYSSTVEGRRASMRTVSFVRTNATLIGCVTCWSSLVPDPAIFHFIKVNNL